MSMFMSLRKVLQTLTLSRAVTYRNNSAALALFLYHYLLKAGVRCTTHSFYAQTAITNQPTCTFLEVSASSKNAFIR